MNRCDLVVTKWRARYLGRSFPCAIGRGGITVRKSEGDGATPAGIYPFAGFSFFYRPDRSRVGGTPLRHHFIWSDDPADPHYNSLRNNIRYSRSVVGRYPFGHEALWRSDPLYDLIVDIGYNAAPAQSGSGSAIFMHRWRKPRHPTEGCIGFSTDMLSWIIKEGRSCDRLIVLA